MLDGPRLFENKEQQLNFIKENQDCLTAFAWAGRELEPGNHITLTASAVIAFLIVRYYVGLAKKDAKYGGLNRNLLLQ
jgi:hypothetical protein